MSSHGCAPPLTSGASRSGTSDDRRDPKGKRVREEARGYAVMKELRRLKTNSLKIEYCDKTGKPVLHNGKIFLSILVKGIRDTISASIPSWKDVSKEHIEIILNWMEVKAMVFPTV